MQKDTSHGDLRAGSPKNVVDDIASVVSLRGRFFDNGSRASFGRFSENDAGDCFARWSHPSDAVGTPDDLFDLASWARGLCWGVLDSEVIVVIASGHG